MFSRLLDQSNAYPLTPESAKQSITNPIRPLTYCLTLLVSKSSTQVTSFLPHRINTRPCGPSALPCLS